MKWSLYVTKINNMNAEYLKKIIPNIATKNKNKHHKKIVKKKQKQPTSSSNNNNNIHNRNNKNLKILSVIIIV